MRISILQVERRKERGLQEKSLTSENPVADAVPELAAELRCAVAARYEESGAAQYGISLEELQRYVGVVVARYGAGLSDGEKLALVRSLHITELALARACSLGSDAAWTEFLARYRADLRRAASQIAKDEGAGRELADELYAELYGLPNQQGRRVSKFDYYMGRGSLAGWLRTVLAQRHVDRCRSRARNVSLDEEMESGGSFAAPEENPAPAPDDRVAEAVGKVLAELNSEERFLLASCYLDRQTLAAIGRCLGVAESTISRRLNKLTAMMRKRIRKRLLSSGMNARKCDEMLQDLDVRDLNIDVTRNLRQEKDIQTF